MRRPGVDHDRDRRLPQDGPGAEVAWVEFVSDVIEVRGVYIAQFQNLGVRHRVAVATSATAGSGTVTSAITVRIDGLGTLRVLVGKRRELCLWDGGR
jgi:hypothetical protein